MTSSADLKEALSLRLKKLEAAGPAIPFPTSGRSSFTKTSTGPTSSAILSTGNPPSLRNSAALQTSMQGNLSNFAPFQAAKPGPTPGNEFSSTSTSSAPSVPSIHCEGYLSKFSSGSLTGRWQRRYFVLSKGRLGYFKKAPPSGTGESKPDKSFSLRKVKEVTSKDASASEREFTLKLGDTVYQLKAATPSEMRKWVSALSTALAQRESLGPGNDEDDENDSSSAVDMISVSNSVSSQASDVSAMNDDVQAYLLQQRAMAAKSAQQQETVWEVDVDPDELDKLFNSWFPHPSDDSTNDSDPSLSELTNGVVSGLTKALSHLYSTLGSEVFDPDMTDLCGQYKRARAVIHSLRRSSGGMGGVEKSVRRGADGGGGDPIKTQLNTVIMEYVTRVIGQVTTYVEKRKELKDGDDDASTVQQLVELMDILSRMMCELSLLFSKQQQQSTGGGGGADCACAYCDPNGVAAKGGDGSDSCSATERWRKSLRNCLQQIGSEFEIGLIEEIQNAIPSAESTWDVGVGSSPTAPNKATHALFGTRLTVWLSSWAPTVIETCQRVGVGILKNEKIQHSKRLVSELIASGLVAVMNSVWRQFKRKSMRTSAFAAQRKNALKQIAELLAGNVGFWSVFSNQQTLAQIQALEQQIPPEESNSLELPNLTAFGNESILLSVFLSESLTEQLPFIPKIFESCFEGLSVTFAAAAAETSSHIVYFHFTERNFAELRQAFAPKLLQTEMKRTPMIVARDLAERFVCDLIPFGTHPGLKTQIVNLLPAAVVGVYVSGLLKNKPKIKQIRNLQSVLESDLIIFKSLFSESRYNCKDTVVAKAIGPLAAVLAFLTETRKTVLLEESSVNLLQSFGLQFAGAVAAILVEMRGNDFSKQERIQLMNVVDPSTQAANGVGQTRQIRATSVVSANGDSDATWRF